MEIGDKIKAFRKFKNITQTQLGNIIGVAGATITRYEKGTISPDLTTLEKIANALDITFVELISYGEPELIKGCLFDFRHIGYLISLLNCHLYGDPDELYCWIEYPDGTLEVNKEDIEELQNSALSYLKFKLEELKQKNYEHFRPKK